MGVKPGSESIHSRPLEILLMGYGYKLAETVSDLTPAQRAYQLMIWAKNHQSHTGA